MSAYHLLALGACTTALVTAPQRSSALQPDPPIACDACREWNESRAPFRVFGNTYYVGVAGLSAILVTSDAGSILLDGGLPQSAARIHQNIQALGFRTDAIRLIVNSHEHYDHAGGIAALQRFSGATVAASGPGARALERGFPGADDPQYAFGESNRYPPVNKVQAVADGERLTVGPLSITAHLTPAHTPGSTTWTWRSCDGGRCLDIVYADSLNPVSAPGFRFSGDATHPSVIDVFRRSIARVARLPCDILLSVHPAFTDMEGKLRRRREGSGADPFVDREGCRAYAAEAARQLEVRLEAEGK
jgi:metallo-beta-lactamase class B